MEALFSPAQGLLILALYGLAAYGLVYLIIRRRRHDKRSFLVADRQVGWRRAAFSIAATWVWAPALFVAALQGYTNGWVGVFWFTVPNVACLMVFAFFAAKVRKQLPDGFTLSAYTRDRLSNRTWRLYLVAFVGLAICSFAVQLLAGGLIVSVLTGIPYWIVSAIMAAIALSYSVRSGLGASILTDYAQMILIAVVGLALAPWVVTSAGGGTTVHGLTGINHDMTSLFTGPGAGVFWAFGLSTSIGLMSGPFGDQSFWQRAWAVKQPDVKKAFILGAGIFALVPLTMSLLGFAAAGAGIAPINDDPQLTNLTAILHWLPQWTVIPFLVFILCGLISTLDSNLAAVSSLTGHDLSKWDPDLASVKHARWGMLALALAAYGLANVPNLKIVALFIFYGTLRSSTLIPTILMLLGRRRIYEGAMFYGILLALLVGVPMSAVGNLNAITPLIWGGSLTVLALSGGITYFGSRIREDKAVLGDRFDFDRGIVPPEEPVMEAA